MTYTAPVQKMLLAMRSAGQLDAAWYNDLSAEDSEAILNEAGRFAADRIAPLNKIGDLNPARLVDGKVKTAPGFAETYRDWCAGGWNSLTGPVSFGGQGLPMIMAAACTEMWNAASISFALCPLLTTGAIEAIHAHASEELKQTYLPKMISGEWSGTMNLTEPQSGSDLSQLRCKAKRHSDGSYRITGNKIYITYGEQDFTSNIIHLVLARLEDAPEGTKGISLFLVPKTLPDGTANDLRCHSLEHKLGIHASPTCTMIYGDHGGATGYLIGEENRGLNCMFTMMNNARLLVGVQGVALADRALQMALAYARERKQGRAPGSTQSSAIIEHPDVKRMLLEMRVKTSAARMLCMATASAIDEASRTKSNAANARAALLTPLAKSYATDVAVEVASAGVQVFGGMGFVEETGIAQLYRDARILPIYEGTNGIQAIDLVTRKLDLDEGRTLSEMLSECERGISHFAGEAVGAKAVAAARALSEIVGKGGSLALASAKPFLNMLAAIVAARCLADAARLASQSLLGEEAASDARYFISTELQSALSIASSAVAAADELLAAKFD